MHLIICAPFRRCSLLFTTRWRRAELLIKEQGEKKKNDDDCGTQKFLPPHAGKIKWHRRQRRLTGSAPKRKTEEVKNVGEEEKAKRGDWGGRREKIKKTKTVRSVERRRILGSGGWGSVHMQLAASCFSGTKGKKTGLVKGVQTLSGTETCFILQSDWKVRNTRPHKTLSSPCCCCGCLVPLSSTSAARATGGSQWGQPLHCARRNSLRGEADKTDETKTFLTWMSWRQETFFMAQLSCKKRRLCPAEIAELRALCDVTRGRNTTLWTKKKLPLPFSLISEALVWGKRRIRWFFMAAVTL